jgi:phosphoribosylformylglycinamidine cyclo-ligase
MSLSYESSGVNYDQLDAFKRACQRAARTTAPLLAAHGYAEPAATRGESAYLIEAPDHYLAHVEEGLGTKNLVADAMADAIHKATGKKQTYYRAIAIDTVATIVNDLITCGALPISVAMHAAVGDSAWFTDTPRMESLVEGWAEGCRQAGAVWGGGETPTLRDIVNPDTIVLAGSAIGKISPKTHRITGDIRDGDAIIFLASSGVQTNGLTLCRKIAAQLPNGYLTPIGHGDPRTYGDALLAPSVIYVAFVRECQRLGIKLNYVAHVTGHGWRKLMRLDEHFVYEITNPHNAGGSSGTGDSPMSLGVATQNTGESPVPLNPHGRDAHATRPAPPALFQFLQESGPITQREMYATYNQGIGFAAYVSPDKTAATLAAAKASGYDAWHAGHVRKDGARKAVLIPSLGLEYDGATLALR